MRKLSVFNSITLDGYFTDQNNDMSWAHKNDDAEFNSFVQENAKSGGELLFGRVTYDMMSSYWQSPAAMENNPTLAKQMNDLPKVVFSSSLIEAKWNNTRIVKGDIANEVRKLKNEPGKDMVIFGSGTIVSQLAQTGLIDQYQIVLIPIVLGAGRTMFNGLREKLDLKLKTTRAFKNGNVFLSYDSLLASEN
ncbi:MAG: dihydrofolate reductase family protein [Pseudobdellovibrionaceae bacterium]